VVDGHIICGCALPSDPGFDKGVCLMDLVVDDGLSGSLDHLVAGDEVGVPGALVNGKVVGLDPAKACDPVIWGGLAI